MRKPRAIYLATMLLIAFGCNMPAAGGAVASTPSVESPGPFTGPGIQITSPLNGSQLAAGQPMQVSYLAKGGPFVEVDLQVDGQPVNTVPTNSQEPEISGSIAWNTPVDGPHNLTVLVVTQEKIVYSASVDISIGVSPAEPNPIQPGTSIPDAGLKAARERVIQILKDRYGLNMTAPPVGRKSRPGVTSDPWISAVYYRDWFISISLYPDGSEAVTAYPVNHADPNANPNFINPNDKSAFIHMCRPSGTIKLLAVFVDYQNLGTTQEEAMDALSQTVAQINGKYVEASHAVGVESPILQIQATGAYLVTPALNPNHLLTPDIVRAATGYDVAQFDILTQIDLDADNTYAAAANFGSYGFAWGGCGDPPSDVHMWIGLTAKDQLFEGSDARLRSTLGHELLHDMGYPIGKTGVHEWICGDGSVPDPYDQCDQNNLPTLMMGWTDTDGDGVVEILDPTPYGYTPP